MKKIAWYDKLQYGTLLLFTALIPIAWRYALWGAMLLGVVTIVKLVASRKIGNPTLNRPLRVALCGPIAYWLMLALSLLWSEDVATGVVLLHLKAVLLIMPLCFLLSDTSYLTARHLRGIGYALLIGCVGAFLYFLVPRQLIIKSPAWTSNRFKIVSIVTNATGSTTMPTLRCTRWLLWRLFITNSPATGKR